MMLTLTVMGSVSLVRGAVPGDLVWAQHENIISNRDDYFRDVAVDGSGIYVVGLVFHAGTDSEWRVEKRSLTTGAIIWFQSENIAGDLDFPYSVAVDASGVYVV